jgi:perosamine synthetase
MRKIPVYSSTLGGNEKKYVNDCLDSNWISSRGKYVTMFEEKFEERIGVKHAAAVSNGTVALHLAAVVLGLGPGDEVLVPTLTYIASANAVAYTGAKPVFVDSDPVTWQMSVEDIKRKITPKTRAIMPVHLYGHPCAMEEIMQIAKDNGLFVIEDCAEALGSYLGKKHVGTFGDISTFSFYGNKTITTGEGGMVVTNDETLFQRVLHFKGQGLASYREYWHDVIGYNYRMTNLSAAIGVAQLEQIDQFLARKREIFHIYKAGLKNLPLQFHEESPGTVHGFWMVNILVPDRADRDGLRAHLSQHGVETRPVFYPVHTMPMYTEKYRSLPVAEDLGWRGITLPSSPDLTDEELGYICTQIHDYFKS